MAVDILCGCALRRYCAVITHPLTLLRELKYCIESHARAFELRLPVAFVVFIFFTCLN